MHPHQQYWSGNVGAGLWGMAVDLNDVAVFESVVSAGSLTAAAERLGQPKSSVSRALARLEADLGVRLLQRTTRKLHLTAAGQLFLSRSQPLLQGLREAEKAVAQLQESPRGSLRITMPVELGMRFMGRVVADFMLQYPEVSVEVELSGRVVNLVDEGFDLGLRIGEFRDSSLVSRKLGNLSACFYASPDYIARRGLPEQPEALRDHEVILFMQSGHNSLQLFRQQARGADVPACRIEVRGRLTVNNVSMACDAASQGLGLVLAPPFLCTDALARGQLLPVLPEYRVCNGGLYAMYPSRDHMPLTLRVFLDFLVQRMHEHPWFS